VINCPIPGRKINPFTGLTPSMKPYCATSRNEIYVGARASGALQHCTLEYQDKFQA
jgi:hypothetical protein